MKTILSAWSATLIALLILSTSGCDWSSRDEGSQAVEGAGQSAGAEAAADSGANKKRRIFVSNYKADTISVLEGDPETEVKSIPGGDSPHGLAIRPTEPRLLAIANSTGFGVSFVDPDTLESKGYVETSRAPQDLEFSPDGKHLWVISPVEWDLHVVDVDTKQIVGEKIRFEKKPRRILWDAPRNRVYLLMVAPEDGEGAEVAVLDPQTREVTKTVPIGKHPQAMGLGNNGKTLVTSSFVDSTLTVINAETLEVEKTIPVETGMGLAVHPAKPIAYSTESFDDTTFVVDLQSGETITKLSPGQWPTYPDFGPGGRYLYIPHEESDSVVKLDTETNQVVTKIAVGKEPIELVVYEP